MKNFLSNMFTSITNGQKALSAYVICAKTRQNIAFLNILWDEGFILSFKIKKENLKIFLHYKKRKPVIRLLKNITKSGNRTYNSIRRLQKIKSENISLIISTNRGLLTVENCKKLKLGGEPFIVLK